MCELAAPAEDALLVLERASETTKTYSVTVDEGLRLGPEYLEVVTRPTIEEMSGAGERLPELTKRLLFTSDDYPEMAADMEGMVLLDERTVLLVSDNDFGVEGKETEFYRLEFEAALVRAIGS